MKAQYIGNDNMELAVGLRGISQYGPIMIGHFKDNPTESDNGVLKYLDSGAQTQFLWPFFAAPSSR